MYLQKTDPAKRAENPKLPYFVLKLIPEEADGEWVEVGALWQAKTGPGYSGMVNEGVTISGSSKKKEGNRAEKAPVVDGD